MKALFDSHAEFFERFLVDAIQDAVIVTRADGSIVLWNRAAEALYGWAAADVVGRQITDITVPSDGLGEAEEILERLRSGEAWAGDFQVRRRDGSTFTAHVRNSPVRDSDGELVGIVGVSYDVSRRRAIETELETRQASLQEQLEEAQRLQQALRAREQAWEFLSESSGALLSDSLDIQQAIKEIPRLATRAFTDWCSLHLLDEVGNIRRVAVAHRVETRRALADEFLNVGVDLRPVEAVIRTREAILVPSISASGLRSTGVDPERADLIAALGLGSAIMVPMMGRERCVGCVSFVRDTGSVAFGEQDLWVAKEFGLRAGLAIENASLFERLQATGRIKDEILGLISHEFRSPLTTILGNVAALARIGEDLDDQTRAEIVDRMQRDGERLERLIENMLTLARGDHAATVEVEPVLLQRLIPPLLERLKGRAPDRELVADLPASLPMVNGVASLIEQIVENLVSNSCKYGRAGTPVRVEAIEQPELGLVIVAVSDEGDVLSQEEIDRFFEPFYRRAESRDGAAGAGLGMAVCSLLVRSLGGDIWARPHDGGGLVVSFSLASTTGGHDE
ncbi:MAG TPA: PAS domain S-box protein [Tepidiformaceae bacterium]|nr:PAS domain S-box protein [Tepidiformaceae bacterium]